MRDVFSLHDDGDIQGYADNGRCQKLQQTISYSEALQERPRYCRFSSLNEIQGLCKILACDTLLGLTHVAMFVQLLGQA